MLTFSIVTYWCITEKYQTISTKEFLPKRGGRYNNKPLDMIPEDKKGSLFSAWFSKLTKGTSRSAAKDSVEAVPLEATLIKTDKKDDAPCTSKPTFYCPSYAGSQGNTISSKFSFLNAVNYWLPWQRLLAGRSRKFIR